MKRIMLLKSIALFLFSGLLAWEAKSQIYYSESTTKEDVSVLYLGYENKITFNLFEGASELRSPNAKVTPKTDDPNSFIIQPTSKDSVVLYWKSKYQDGSGKDVEKDHLTKFPVKLLPKAELCVGNTKNQGKLDGTNMMLNYCYSEKTPEFMKLSMKPEKWILSIEGSKKNFSGTGAQLSVEAIDAIKKAKGNKKITISTVSSGNSAVTGTFQGFK